MACLLVDVGSTFIKYNVYNEISKKVLLYDKVAFPSPNLNKGCFFSVPISKINESIDLILEATQKFNCTKMFFCVQMHGYILRYTDNSFSDYISWRDNSGDISDVRLKNIDFNDMGTSLKRNLPLVKLAFKDISGEFFTLGSYIVWRLTKKNATHITDAAATGFFYAESGKRNEFAENLRMPKVYTDITPVGNYRDMIIYTAVGDHQSSFLGSGAADKKYLLNIGTAIQISCVHSGDYPDGEYEKRPYFDKKRLYTVSGLVGGGKIYDGEGCDELFSQILNAIKHLPPKKELILGGGGSEKFYRFLKEKNEELGLKCSLAKENIGIEGLKMISNSANIKVGTMLSEICFSNFPIIAKNNGLNFIIVDNEHGHFDYSDIARLTVIANLAGIDMIVRIGDSDRGHITKLADMGVSGFLLPMTNTPEDIEKVIQYAKYPPIGKRGVSTTRAHTLYSPPPLEEYFDEANKKMKIYAQIETSEGIKNLDKILALKDVDGVFIGPNDMSVDIGCIGNKPKLLEIIEKIAKLANEANKPFGIITGDKMLIEASKKYNVSMISVGSELNMLINGCKKIKEDILNG